MFDLVDVNKFGGSVVSYPIKNLENIKDELEKAGLFLSETGFKSFMKALKIPAKYYDKQLDSVKKDLLLREKVGMDDVDSVLFIKRGQELVYSALENTVFGVKEFNDFVGGKVDNVVWLGENLNKGINSYVINRPAVAKDEFGTALFVEYPILNQGSIKFEVGMYRLVCNNGLLDKVTNKPMSIRMDIEPAFIVGYLLGFLNGMESFYTLHDEFITYLKNKTLTADDLEGKLRMLLKGTTKELVSDVRSWLELDALGKGKVMIPDVEKINNTYDFVNGVTRLAQKSGDLVKIKKIDATIFSRYFEQFKIEEKKTVSVVALKEMAQGFDFDTFSGVSKN